MKIKPWHLRIIAGIFVVAEVASILLTITHFEDLHITKSEYLSENSKMHKELLDCEKRTSTCEDGLQQVNGKCQIKFDGEYENAKSACLDRDSKANIRILDLYRYMKNKGHLPEKIRSGWAYAACTPEMKDQWRKERGYWPYSTSVTK